MVPLTMSARHRSHASVLTTAVAALLLTCQSALRFVLAACPSSCNGHGVCTPANTCSCFEGYTGFDCFARSCPSAPPWIDFAIADDDTRSIARECSNMGTCDRGSGQCRCQSGFEGHACETMTLLCKDQCNGRGRCMRLTNAADLKNDYNLFRQNTYTTPWDAERIHGCVCDYGYTGADCSQRECPRGDDPVTTAQVDEIQALSCLCNGCSGVFSLTFRGYTTRDLDPATETASTLKQALEALPTIHTLSITLSGGSMVCDTDGVSSIITFTHEHGDVPALIATSSFTGGTSSLTVEADGTAALYGANTATQVGTKEGTQWLPCSGRGVCNSFSGECSCDSGFESSDGQGAEGTIPDCGYRSGGAMTSCPVSWGATCSAHGHCSGASNYQCTCFEGFSGHDCSIRECPTDRAWWEEPTANDVAHTSLVECSNAGVCDAVGICQCFPGFEGVACSRLSCPKQDEQVCSGRGVCRTAKDIAALTETAAYGVAGFVYGSDPNAVSTWDANMMQGCYCDKIHVDQGQPLRYTGYNCAKIPCPSGDDPWTSSQVDEVQTVSCTADGGYLTLSFRGETSAMIPTSASAAFVKFALERLRTINLVTVAFNSGVSTVCTTAGPAVQITFHSPSGDLPNLVLDASLLTNTGGAVSTSVSETTAGTKEDSVCNNRGRCDEDLGQCICAQAHASSDGMGGYGALDDCGVVDEFMTHGVL